MFEVEETGPNHFLVSWDPPSETNGVLLGFTIGYRLGKYSSFAKALSFASSNKYLGYIHK